MYESFNSFVTFPGDLSLVYTDDFMESFSEYTISTWIRFDQLPWQKGRDMTFLSLSAGSTSFTCKLAQDKNLRCDSNREQTLSVSFDPVAGHWYIFTLRSSQTEA